MKGLSANSGNSQTDYQTKNQFFRFLAGMLSALSLGFLKT